MVHRQRQLNNSDGRHGTRPASGLSRTRAPDTAAANAAMQRAVSGLLLRGPARLTQMPPYGRRLRCAHLQARAIQLCPLLPAPSIAPALRPVAKAPAAAAEIAQAARCLRVPLRRRW